MSSGLASDEVSEDYKNSLEDLTTNDRFQISNLTVIAKENTEHAMAISRVLENHIRTVGYSVQYPPNPNSFIVPGGMKCNVVYRSVLICVCRPHHLRSFQLFT